MDRETAKRLRQGRRERERESLYTVLLLGLGFVAYLVTIFYRVPPWATGALVFVATAALAARKRRLNGLCRACGTKGAMRRIGWRRFGYVRVRCSACGAERTVVIPPKDERY